MPRKEVSKEECISAGISNTALRPKRRPKAPKGALGERLKAKAAPAQTRPFSPLPPSSPIASSSSQLLQDFLPVPTSDGEAELQPIEKPFYEEVDDECDFELGIPDEVEDVQRDVGLPAKNSDPFGFFALEAKLKAERIQRSTMVSKVPPSPPVTRPLKVPRSPHKQRVGKRLADNKSPSLPSSPSPAKLRRVTKRHMDKEAMDISDETEREYAEDDASDLDNPLPKPPKSKAGGRRRKKARSSDNSIDPETLARDLKALLPKRATRRDIRPARGRPRASSDSPRPHKALKRGKEKIIGDDIEPELAAERRRHVEYYKKLEGYKLAKENVYVI